MVVETGTPAGELLTGSSDADTLDGAGGNDTINGLGNADVLIGGLGADLIDGGAGNDTITGTTGLDSEVSFVGADTLIGGLGDDSIEAGGNTALMQGGSGDDFLGGGPEDYSQTLDGGDGADRLWGGGGADVYIVDNLLDITHEFTYDVLGAGNTATGDIDEIRSSISWVMRDWNDDGYNIENLTLLGSADINATANEVGNVVTGNSGDNELSGLAGDDTIIGGAGDDTIIGGTGDDELSGGTGTDVFRFSPGDGDDTITDFQFGVDQIDFTGTDIRTKSANGDGDRVITLNNDVTVTLLGVPLNYDPEIISTASPTGSQDVAYSYTLNTTDADGDTVSIDALNTVLPDWLTNTTGTTFAGTPDASDVGTFEVTFAVEDGEGGTDSQTFDLTISGADIEPTLSVNYGTPLADSILGDALANFIVAYDSNDTVDAGAGGDIIYDGQGDDQLSGGAGNDTYFVGDGSNIVTEGFNQGTDTVIHYGSAYTLTDNVENLILQDLRTTIVDTVKGGNPVRAVETPGFESEGGGGPELAGFDYTEFLVSESENLSNIILNPDGTGNALDNVITGNSGNNFLRGLGGNDTIIGGGGNDIMEGGAGADVFRPDSGDTILDFQSGVDKIDLSALEASGGSAVTVGGIAGLKTTDITFGGSQTINSSASTSYRAARIDFGADYGFGERPNAVYSTFNEGQGKASVDLSYYRDASVKLAGFTIQVEINAPLQRSDFLLPGAQFDRTREWTDSTTVAEFGPGETTSWGIGVGYNLGTASNFGAGDSMKVELRNDPVPEEPFSFNIGLSYALDNGLSLFPSYQFGDPAGSNAAITDSYAIALTQSFSTANENELAFERSAQSIADQGVATEALVLEIDRDFDGVKDFDLTLEGDYQDTVFRTEYINENLVISVYEGNSHWTGSLQIEGTPRLGQALTADISNLFDRDGIVLSTVEYQWFHNGHAITGATGQSYTLALADVLSVINVQMTYTDGFGNEETVLSETTLPVGIVDIPATGDVSINGTPQQGETLIADLSDISDTNIIDPLQSTFQWLRDGEVIDGATEIDYTLVQRDVGAQISLFHTFEDFSGGTGERTSSPTSAVANVNDAATGRAAFSGRVEVGATLQADLSGIADLDGTTGINGTATYTWLSGGTAIAGATAASYVVTEAELAEGVALQVDFEDDLGGSETLTSAVVRAPIPGSFFAGTPQVDTMNGTIGDDIFDGLASDDVFAGGQGNDIYSGGEGLDTAQFSGNQSSYTVILSAGDLVVEDRRDADAGGQGTDRLASVEFLDFDTEHPAFGGNPLNLTQFGNVASLSEADFSAFIELYIAYFNRAPDAIGLFFWGTAVEKGLSLDDVATLFFDQDETRETYPFLSNTENFAKEVYANVLGREFDQAGLDFWVGVLDSGDVGLPTFMLEIINGAKAAPRPGDAPELTAQKLADVEYLTNKTDLGAYFSVIKGMSDVDNARTALDLYNGTQASIDISKAAIDGFYEDALDAQNGEFLFSLTGVVDDPFAIA